MLESKRMCVSISTRGCACSTRRWMCVSTYMYIYIYIIFVFTIGGTRSVLRRLDNYLDHRVAFAFARSHQLVIYTIGGTRGVLRRLDSSFDHRVRGMVWGGVVQNHFGTRASQLVQISLGAWIPILCTRAARHIKAQQIPSLKSSAPMLALQSSSITTPTRKANWLPRS